MKVIIVTIFFLLSISELYSQTERLIHFEGGVLTYGPATSKLGYSLRGVNSWSYTDKIYAGVGIGFEKYTFNENRPIKVLPIFGQAKYVLYPEKKKSLYGTIDLGYSLSLNKSEKTTNTKNSYNGGLLASPQLGFMWYTAKDKKSHITFSFGYNYQGFTEKGYYNYVGWMSNINDNNISSTREDQILNGYDYYTKNKYHLHRLSIMLGFGF